MKTKHLIITLLACCLFTISCKDEEKDSVVPETEKPSEDTPAVKPGAKIGEVNAVQGTVYYNESLRLWFIYVIEKGTIDCTECYFPTNISDDFKIDGLRVIFSGTVYENIAYGRPDASREEVIEAAVRAGADAFIRELRDGYDTYIGERGVKLSGGQKQRISIARIFLKNPPIIILDEATSALDNESEYEVAKSLAELSKGRTTLTIAHRLSSIVHSDRILVLTEDGIVEEGTHAELMDRQGIYCQFYTRANEIR